MARTTRHSGFSLIELMIVAVLLLGLTTMYWGSNTASRQRKQQVLCQQNLQKIFVALQIYATDQSGKFPEATNAQTSEAVLDRLVPKYTVDTDSFICPGSGNSSLPSVESLLKHRISYAYYMGWRATDEQMVLMTDRQVNTSAKTNGQRIFSDTGAAPGNNHKKYGGNLLFCDGHIQISPSATPVALPVPSGVVLLNPK